MRRVLIACALAGLAAACGKKEETSTRDVAEEWGKVVEDASKLPDVSITIPGTPGPAIARHLVDHWAVYGKTPDRYAMAESIVMIDDLPPEAKAVGVKGTAGFHFKGEGPYFTDVLLGYAMFDNPENAAVFLDNMSDSNADAEGIKLEESFMMGKEGGPEEEMRCAIVPDTGNAVTCYYQDFTGHIVTTLLFSPGPPTDPNATDLGLMVDELETVFGNEEHFDRIMDHADASSGYLARVTKQIPRKK